MANYWSRIKRGTNADQLHIDNDDNNQSDNDNEMITNE